MVDSEKTSKTEVVCKGDHREMGIAQGIGMREKLEKSAEILSRLDPFLRRKPWWLPYGSYKKLSQRKAERVLKHPLRKQFPEMAQRLEGIAEGAQIHPGELYLYNALDALISSVTHMIVIPPLSGCSALAVRGSKSLSAKPVIARNFDYLPLVQPLYSIRESHPNGKFRSLEFTVAPLCGTIDGVNERGLCITYNYAYVSDGPAQAPTISMVISEAMAVCSTVSEAAEFIASTPRWGGGLLMLADETGDLASLELSNTRSHLRRPADNEDYLFHSNAFHSETMQEVQVSARAVFSRKAPDVLRGHRVLESSECRDQRFEKLLSQCDSLGPDDLSVVMSDHGPDDEPSLNTICKHSSYWNTTASLQLFPATRSIRVAFDSTCQARYQEFGLDY
jgi:predicted choloylglycine hydrolase